MLSGTIIEESLSDKSVLDGLKIVNSKVAPVTEKFQTPWLKQWTLHSVEIPEVFGETIAQRLSAALEKEHAWYADFKNDSVHYIIFRNKVFKISRKSRQEYEQAARYGLSLGIPQYQVDFAKNAIN